MESNEADSRPDNVTALFPSYSASPVPSFDDFDFFLYLLLFFTVFYTCMSFLFYNVMPVSC